MAQERKNPHLAVTVKLRPSSAIVSGPLSSSLVASCMALGKLGGDLCNEQGLARGAADAHAGTSPQGIESRNGCIGERLVSTINTIKI